MANLNTICMVISCVWLSDWLSDNSLELHLKCKLSICLKLLNNLLITFFIFFYSNGIQIFWEMQLESCLKKDFSTMRCCGWQHPCRTHICLHLWVIQLLTGMTCNMAYGPATVTGNSGTACGNLTTNCFTTWLTNSPAICPTTASQTM